MASSLDHPVAEPIRWTAVLDRIETALIQIRVASESKDAQADQPISTLNMDQADSPWRLGLTELQQHLDTLTSCEDRAQELTAEIDRLLADCQSDLNLWWEEATRRGQRLTQAVTTSL